MNTITLRQVKKSELLEADWLLAETPEGWMVKCGDATLVDINSRKPRYFSDVNRAIQRLKKDLGIHTMKLVTM